MNSQESGALFSKDRLYRTLLWRRWQDGPSCVFIGLNPSTADEATLDPTCTRCMNFAKDWSYCSYQMLNIFALRSTDPRGVYKASDPVGQGNDFQIVQTCKQAALVVCAWGNHGQHLGRASQVIELLKQYKIKAKCLGLTKYGQPKHPLYIKADTKPIPFID